MVGMNTENIVALLKKWVTRQLEPEARNWWEERWLQSIHQKEERFFYITFGMLPKKLNKSPIILSVEDQKEAQNARAGWNPKHWTLEQSARVALILAFPCTKAEEFVQRLDALCQTADMGELVGIYQGLAVYPWPEAHVARASEGIRSNMKAVFEAVAHQNPYPSEYLPEGAWNQMVLKALFVGSPLYKIQGIDTRVNADLAQMLVDYAHERWAAKRPVVVELWRCVGLYATEKMLEDFQRLLTQGTEEEQKAAVLALQACPLAGAKTLLKTVPVLEKEAQTHLWNWETLSFQKN